MRAQLVQVLVAVSSHALSALCRLSYTRSIYAEPSLHSLVDAHAGTHCFATPSGKALILTGMLKLENSAICASG